MTIVLASGTQVRDNVFRNAVSVAASTATVSRAIDPTYDVVTIGLATSATVGLNQFTLATDSVFEGKEVTIQATATGTGTVMMTGTATGFLVFTAATDHARVRQSSGIWYLERNSGATFGTSTA